jgi:hypothetical protein
VRGKTWEPVTDQLLTLQYQHDALLSAYQKRGVAAELREWRDDEDNVTDIDACADELDPPEPVAEADAAEKFSQDCARRRVEAEK